MQLLTLFYTLKEENEKSKQIEQESRKCLSKTFCTGALRMILSQHIVVQKKLK